MKNTLAICLWLLAGLIAVSACRTAPEPPAAPLSPVSVVPLPQSATLEPGSFTVTAQTVFVVEPENEGAAEVARYLAEKLGAAAGAQFSVSQGASAPAANGFFFKKAADAATPGEAYRLHITSAGVVLEAAAPAGFLYGTQTVLQLLPAEVFSGKSVTAPLTLPCVDIQDAPRLPWRGMMLDCSRHFFPKEFVLKYIDFLVLHKMNTFHWHLTDDQGWRIEIKKYPKLTEVGAWRVDREDKHWNERPPQTAEEKATYGGFYTQDEIREVIAYAKSRFITVVPEIEMPGHCLSALAGYPQFSCSGGPFTVPPGGVWPILDVYCPGNEGTFAFLEDILSEVCDLFPGEYIHIGGDEVDKATWTACPKCQARIKKEGLKDEEELQSYFVKRIEKFLNAKGKKLIGWDEILQGGLAPNAAVMSWRGTEGGIAAARAGHDVVMSPTTHCYFDYYQGDPATEPLAIGGYLPLSRVYDFNPTPAELTPDEAAHIIGAQANLWTEYVPTTAHAEYMTFPRIAAIAEIGWTAQDKRDWTDFHLPHGQAVRALPAGGHQRRRERLRRQIQARARPGQADLRDRARDRHLPAGHPVHARRERAGRGLSGLQAADRPQDDGRHQGRDLRRGPAGRQAVRGPGDRSPGAGHSGRPGLPLQGPLHRRRTVGLDGRAPRLDRAGRRALAGLRGR